MTSLVHTDGSKTLYIASEILASPGNIGMWKESIRNWEPPYNHERIDKKKREAIVDSIRRAFHWKGETIDVI